MVESIWNCGNNYNQVYVYTRFLVLQNFFSKSNLYINQLSFITQVDVLMFLSPSSIMDNIYLLIDIFYREKLRDQASFFSVSQIQYIVDYL